MAVLTGVMVSTIEEAPRKSFGGLGAPANCLKVFTIKGQPLSKQAQQRYLLASGFPIGLFCYACSRGFNGIFEVLSIHVSGLFCAKSMVFIAFYKRFHWVSARDVVGAQET